MALFDMHTHSCFSRDALPRPASIARQAERIGLAGIAVTDHNGTGSFSSFGRVSGKKLLVVFGEEVKVVEGGRCMGEVLCYFVRERIKPGSFGEVLDSARDQGCLVASAHPFDARRSGFADKSLLKRLDAVEAFNARASEKANSLATGFAMKNRVPVVAGSDAHSLAEIGKGGIECNAQSGEELRKAIMKRECFVYSSSPAPPFAQWVCSAKARLGFME